MTKDTAKFLVKPYVLKVEKPWGYELILTNENSKKLQVKFCT